MSVFDSPYFSAYSAFQPVGAAAAGSAIAMGFAGQMYGVAFGMVTGAMNATSKLVKTEFDLPSMPQTLPNPYTFEWDFGSATAGGASEPKATKKAVKTVAQEKPARTMAKKTVEEKAVTTKAAQTNPKTLMPEDFTRPIAMTKPAKPDDLKLISGVGPKLEAVLNGLGIWTFAQVAQWTPNEVAWVDDYLQFKGRIERDEWLAQAASFAAGK